MDRDKRSVTRRAYRWIAAQLVAEQDRWFLWLVATYVAGIAVYFALPREPLGGAFAALALLLAIAAWQTRRRAAAAMWLLLPAVLAAGIASAKWRAERVAAPVLLEAVAGAQVRGWVERKETRADGRKRLTVQVFDISRIAPDATPYRVRVTARALPAWLGPGTPVAFRAWLAPPRGPVAPGAYDFARNAYFARIGANGTVLGAPSLWRDAPTAPASLRAKARIEQLRYALAERIMAAVPGASGALAVALLTGIRDFIPETAVVALRDAGLAHVLAISGLHMSLVAGTLFWLVRAGLALSPALALRWPLKKLAALAALAGAAGYLMISGQGIATQRAFVMIAIMLVAILLDRPAITMRNVALAALVVAAIEPEAVVTPSFQMSFAAVTGLIAFYEVRRRADKTRARPASAPASASVSASLWAARRTGFYVAALIATTLVASAATAPFILYHFQRLAPFGLAGNLFALPVVGFLVMPAGLISVIAVPFGLEPLTLPVMAAGIEWVLRVAETIAALPGAERPVAAPPAAALALAVLGGLWLTLWRRRWRGFGLLGFAAAGVMMVLARPPDVVIAPQGRVLAVRGADGGLDLKRFGRSTFAAEILLARYGDGRPVEQVAEDAFSCDKLACVAPLPDGGYMAFVSHRAALAEECARARVLVAAFELKRPCEGPQLVVDRVEEPEFRASALWLGRSGIEVRHAGTAPGARPWSPPAPEGRRASTDE